jgi:hypothetical protein
LIRLPLAAATAQVQAYVDFLHQSNSLATRSLRRFEEERAQRAFAKTVLQGRKPRLGSYEFSAVGFRSVRGTTLQGVLAIDRSLHPQRALRVFVGHRFTPAVTNNLRHNLQLSCRPYGINLWYSDTDTPNGSVFDTIVSRIGQSDFCIFDDRETEIRPNVLIELGVAIGMNKPYFYLNYHQKRTVTIRRQKERITTPSDLAGMLYIPYTTYEDLARELAMRMPGFLVNRRFARRESPGV